MTSVCSRSNAGSRTSASSAFAERFFVREVAIQQAHAELVHMKSIDHFFSTSVLSWLARGSVLLGATLVVFLPIELWQRWRASAPW
jgi:hypothetical protein